MNLSTDFIVAVKRVISLEYIRNLIGLASTTQDGLMSKEDKSALDTLATHNHDDRYYTETESDALFAPISHDHDSRYYTETEIDAAFTALSSTYAPLSHTHDDRYYTESETDTLLSSKIDSSSYTASDVLSKITTVDGAGSGLDADLLDGQQGSYYLPQNDNVSGDGYIGRNLGHYDGASAASSIGAIKITIPNPTNYNNMILVRVVVFEYTSGESFELMAGGYHRPLGTTWVNCSAWLTCQPGSTLNHTVRFGEDGTNKCIWIGELADAWSYPKIFVSEVYSSHTAAPTIGSRPWYISLVSSFNTVDVTITNTQV